MNSRPSATDRPAAAALLRAVRASRGSTCRDAVDWAFLALPDCPAAQRLKIQQLMQQADHDGADAMLARALLVRPRDRGLRFLLAKRRLQASNADLAWVTIEGLLRERPHHQATLLLAADIARARRDHAAAASLLQRAIDHPNRTGRATALTGLIEVLIESGRAGRAERLLEGAADAPAALWAALRRLQGRWLDVVDILDTAIRHACGEDERDRLLVDLIDALELVGDMPRLNEVVRGLDRRHPRAMVRAGLALLATGEFAIAARHVRPLARGRTPIDGALAVIHLAAAMTDRPRIARRSLELFQACTGPPDIGSMARAWRCGIRGRVLADQVSAVHSGADPESGVLADLIREAADVFDEALAAADEASDERLELCRHRAACAAAPSQVAA